LAGLIANLYIVEEESEILKELGRVHYVKTIASVVPARIESLAW